MRASTGDKIAPYLLLAAMTKDYEVGLKTSRKLTRSTIPHAEWGCRKRKFCDRFEALGEEDRWFRGVVAEFGKPVLTG
jgi:hypothetical protein